MENVYQEFYVVLFFFIAVAVTVVVVVVVGRSYRSVAGVGVGAARWRPRQLRTAATALYVSAIRPWGAEGDGGGVRWGCDAVRDVEMQNRAGIYRSGGWGRGGNVTRRGCAAFGMTV